MIYNQIPVVNGDVAPQGTPTVADVMQATLHPQAPTHGFVAPIGEMARPLAMPEWFVDRCRQAYLSISFPGPQRILGITSAAPGEGKTTVALGMLNAIATDTGEPTVLLECDLATGSDQVLGVMSGPGLGEWLSGYSSLRLVRMPPLNNAFMIPAGGMHQDAARVFYRLSQGDLMKELQTEFPNIIIDLPPVLSVSYSSLAVQIAEHLLLVARYGVTRIEDLEEALTKLGPDRIDGIILNAYAPKTPGWLRRLL